MSCVGRGGGAVGRSTPDLADALAGEVGVAVKVILVEGVLNANDGVALAVAAVQLLQLAPCLDVVRVGLVSLEVQVVLVVLKELAGGYIHANLDLACVPSFLHNMERAVLTDLAYVPRLLQITGRGLDQAHIPSSLQKGVVHAHVPSILQIAGRGTCLSTLLSAGPEERAQ